MIKRDSSNRSRLLMPWRRISQVRIDRPTAMMSRLRTASVRSVPTNALANEPTTVTNPALPRMMRYDAIFRRIGWSTMTSDSLVVKPALVNAESAWNFARSHGMPVTSNSRAPIRTMTNEAMMNTKRRTMDTAGEYPDVHRPSWPARR